MTSPLPLRGRRLTIRRFRDDDVTAFHGYRSDPDVARYQSWDADYTLSEARQFVAAVKAAPLMVPGEWIQLAVDVRGTMIGDVGVGFGSDRSVAEMGFTIAPEFQRQGYATEAVETVLGWLPSQGVESVIAIVDARNRASQRVVERAGMAGMSRHNTVFKGEPCVEITYGLSLSGSPTPG